MFDYGRIGRTILVRANLDFNFAIDELDPRCSELCTQPICINILRDHTLNDEYVAYNVSRRQWLLMMMMLVYFTGCSLR